MLIYDDMMRWRMVAFNRERWKDHGRIVFQSMMTQWKRLEG